MEKTCKELRASIAQQLEDKYLNRIAKFRTVNNVIVYGKVDKIAFECFKGGIVAFVINNDRYEADLDWISENFVTL
jgi:hypothetical protein